MKTQKLLPTFFIVALILLQATTAFATTGGTDIVAIVKKTSSMLKTIALFIGPGIGIIFALSGIMKIRRKDEDPREFSKGIMYIIAGVGCAMVGLIISWILNFYGGASYYEQINVLQ